MRLDMPPHHPLDKVALAAGGTQSNPRLRAKPLPIGKPAKQSCRILCPMSPAFLPSSFGVLTYGLRQFSLDHPGAVGLKLRRGGHSVSVVVLHSRPCGIGRVARRDRPRIAGASKLRTFGSRPARSMSR